MLSIKVYIHINWGYNYVKQWLWRIWVNWGMNCMINVRLQNEGAHIIQLGAILNISYWNLIGSEASIVITAMVWDIYHYCFYTQVQLNSMALSSKRFYSALALFSFPSRSDDSRSTVTTEGFTFSSVAVKCSGISVYLSLLRLFVLELYSLLL